MKSFRNGSAYFRVEHERFQSDTGTVYTCKLIETRSVGCECPETVVGSGVARVNPTDRPDDAIGCNLAEARAFKNYANRLRRRAEGLVRHNDNMAAASGEKIKRDLERTTESLVEESGSVTLNSVDKLKKAVADNISEILPRTVTSEGNIVRHQATASLK